METFGVIIVATFAFIWIIGFVSMIISFFEKPDLSETILSMRVVKPNKKVYINNLDFDDDNEADVILSDDYV